MLTAIITIIAVLVVALGVLGLRLKSVSKAKEQYKYDYLKELTANKFLQKKIINLEVVQKDLQKINECLQQQLLEPNSKTLEEAKERLENEFKENERDWFSVYNS